MDIIYNEVINVIYGKYKNVRNSAWQCLIDFNITCLPTDVFQIAREADIKIIKNSNAKVLKPNEIGTSFLIGDKWHVVYRDTDIRPRCRFTIAHELGHIFLGHKLKNGKHTRRFGTTIPEEEDEANRFAARILTPACVIWALDLHTPQEIAQLCDVSRPVSEKRAKRMEVLYQRNRFLLSPLERQVYRNFEEFIKEQKKPRQ